MLKFNILEQKSLLRRFLFVLGLVMMLIYFSMGIIVIFFNDMLNIDEAKFSNKARIGFGILLIVYAVFRFSRLLYKKRDDTD